MAPYGLLLTMILLLLPVQAHAAWLGSGWSSRGTVTVSNPGGTPLSNFQVHVVLNSSSFDFNKAKSDGSDIRFTTSDGVTPISFWIEGWSAANKIASIWVKVPSIAAGGASLYMYYGNASATDASDGTSTFEFFDDFESGTTGTTLNGYYTLGNPQTVMVQDQGWENSAPHTLSVVQPDPGVNNGHTYWGYYGLQGRDSNGVCDPGGVGLAYSNDLVNWTKDTTNNPLFLNGRWPSVRKINSTYYMFYTRDFCATSYIKLATSSDGVSFSDVKTIVSPQDTLRNQNPDFFFNPNDGKYYLYWYHGHETTDSTAYWEIHVRSANTPEGLDTAPEIVVLHSDNTLAAPHMLYLNGTYFLSTEILDISNNWAVLVYSSSSPTSGFTLLPGNPVLAGDPLNASGAACMFQYVFGNTLHEYYCMLNGTTWTLDHRTADLTAGRTLIQEQTLDAGKWSATGGAWSIVNDTQPDDTTGGVALGYIAIGDTREALLSLYGGTDYVMEAYGKQVVGGVWGLGVRATDENNLDVVSLYGSDTLAPNLTVTNLLGGTGAPTGVTTGAVDVNTWYKLTVKAHGGTIDVSRDDVPVLTGAGSTGPGSHIALYSQGESVVEFNNVLVRKYAANEPPDATVTIDTTVPSVTSFATATLSSSFNIPITSFIASDNVGVASYLITTTSTKPALDNPNWSGTIPTIYTITTGLDGTYTLYPWAMDNAGNISNSSSKAVSVVVDTTPPNTTITGQPSSTTNQTNASFTFTSSESGSTFQCQMDGGGYSACTSPASYSGLASNQTHTFNVRAIDKAGNTDPSPATYSWVIDTTAPTVLISTTASNPTRTSPIPVTVTFSKPVTGFIGSDVVVGNGTVQGSISGSGASYSFNVNPNPNSTVTVDIPAGVAQDGAGNGNTAATQLSVVFDNTAPTILISAPSLTVTDSGSVTYTVTYTGADNISLATNNVTLNKTGNANGTVGVSGSGTVTRTVTILGITGDGTLGISIAANTASDAAGNTAAAAGPSTTFTVDNTPPSLLISAPSSAVTSTNQVTYTVTYTGADNISLAAGSVTLNKTGTANGTVAVSGSGNVTRTVTISGITGDGTLGISIAANTASDQAGNTAAAAGPSATFTVDNTPPNTTITSQPSSLTNQTNASFSFTSEVGATFQCQMDGGTFASCTSPASYSSLASNQTHTFNVRAIDQAGNIDQTPATYSWVIDTIAPTLLISAPSLTITDGGSVTYTVTYTGADSVSLVVGNVTLNKTGTANGTVGVTGGGNVTRTVTISGLSGDGTLSITIAAGTASDLAGNSAAAAGPSTAFTVDNTPPDTTITSQPSNPTNQTSASFSFTSTEAGSTFQCKLDNGSFAACTSPASYSGLASNQTHTFNVRATDPAGNTDPTPAAYSWVIDTTPPDTVILTHPSNITNQTSASFTFSSTEVGSTFQCKLDNGSFSACTSPASYSILAGGLTHTFSVTATDPAGNADPTPATFSWVIDTTVPTAVISAPSVAAANNTGTVTYTVTYSGADSVTLAAGDVTLNKTGSANATVNVSGSGFVSRTITVSSITGRGTLGISIAANTASNNAGNQASAAGPSATFIVSNASGDINGDGTIDMTDALLVLRIAAGLDAPTASDLASGDVAPLVNGAPQPDGKIDIGDVVAILRRAAGLTNW